MVTVVDLRRIGDSAVDLVYRKRDGTKGTILLYRADEPRLRIVNPEDTPTFSASANQFRLATEAFRVEIAHLFDPVLAVHTSLVEPLPHQITAVYGEMLARIKTGLSRDDTSMDGDHAAWVQLGLGLVLEPQ